MISSSDILKSVKLGRSTKDVVVKLSRNVNFTESYLKNVDEFAMIVCRKMFVYKALK